MKRHWLQALPRPLPRNLLQHAAPTSATAPHPPQAAVLSHHPHCLVVRRRLAPGSPAAQPKRRGPCHHSSRPHPACVCSSGKHSCTLALTAVHLHPPATTVKARMTVCWRRRSVTRLTPPRRRSAASARLEARACRHQQRKHHVGQQQQQQVLALVAVVGTACRLRAAA